MSLGVWMLQLDNNLRLKQLSCKGYALLNVNVRSRECMVSSYVWYYNIQGVSVLKIKTSTTCKYRQKYTHNR